MEDLDGRTEAFKKRDATSGAASSPRPNTASPREQSSAQRKRLMEDTAKLQKDAAGRVQKYEEENAKLRDLLDQTRKDAAGRSQKYEEQIAKLQARLAGQTPRAQPAGPQAPPTSGATVRTWSDATGQFRVEAELVEIKDATAVLKKSDGKLLQVPLSKLSNADREYVRQSQVGPKTREPARSETSRKE
jgi:small-conductance mechanosensitive channel